MQCSDCGSTWFQHHPDHANGDAIADENAAPAPEPQDTHPDRETDSWQADYGADESDDVPEDTQHEDTVTEDASADEFDTPSSLLDPVDEVPPPEPKRRAIDPAVADVLREEAERESRARERDNRGTVETQQELGLQDTDNDAQRRSEEARARMARLRGEPEAQKTEAEVLDIDPSSRSNLLPDIDEINSSLDSDGKKEGPRSSEDVSETAVAPRKTGFRSGFRMAIALAVLGVVLYVFAPQLSDAVPQLAGPLSGFVDIVNGWRTGLNDLIQNLASSLSESSASDG